MKFSTYQKACINLKIQHTFHDFVTSAWSILALEQSIDELLDGTGLQRLFLSRRDLNSDGVRILRMSRTLTDRIYR
jgi:hypothetical protein